MSIHDHVESGESAVTVLCEPSRRSDWMWTTENRGRYDRRELRYPSNRTDDEWVLIGPLIPRAKRGGNKPTVDVREV